MSDPRTIILLNDFGWVNGGQSKVAIDSALMLRGAGLDVCFVAGRGPVDPRLEAAGVDVRVVGDHDILSDPNRRRAAFSGIWNREAARVVGNAIDDHDPATTVVHVHGWAKALSPSIGPVVTGAEAAHVYTLHEYFLACPNGGFYDHPAREICTRRALGPSCLATNCDSRSRLHKMWRVARQTVLWTRGRMPRDLRELIYLAPQQEAILGSYMPAAARWHFLPNPVDAAPPERVAAERNAPFLFVGRLSPEKGGLLAAAAARRAGVEIVFAGEGEERDAIARVNPEAQMRGWLSTDALADVMAKARALVFPSLWYETYGLVVADALRIGLPVLLSEDCVATNLVGDGGAGLTFATGDVDALAGAMRQYRDDDRVRAASEAAFARGATLPGHDEQLEALIGVYRAAMARQAGRSRRGVAA